MFLPMAPEIEDPESDIALSALDTDFPQCSIFDIHLDNATDG